MMARNVAVKVLMLQLFYLTTRSISGGLISRYNVHTGQCETFESSRSLLECTARCSSNSNCSASSYESRQCFTCPMNASMELQFGNGSFYWPRERKETGVVITTYAAKFTLDGLSGLKAGTWVYLQAFYTSSNGFRFHFIQTTGSTLLEFRTRVSTLPYVTMNTMLNGVFKKEIKLNFNVTSFAIGQLFHVHFLVRSDAFLIYINHQFVQKYVHFFSPSGITSIIIYDPIQVMEVSL
ncbi:uncharacterized protein LOC131956843 [Physella acuta]|uniref:uncharacterized protein LOC131956843 n=1 Tax=Physella acuta TaxID=109671 RepID=UPI0027DD403F|nr:uncharacterized protein LOC131956843 [Physella acuta]